MSTRPKRSTKPRAKKAAGETWQSVLKLWPKARDGKPTPRDAGRVHRAFVAYRAEKGLPDRCDNKVCKFHQEPLVWNDEPLNLILDHEDGNRFNNLPPNLQYLCPNCNSQSPWNGGKAKGRVIDSSVDGWILQAPKGGWKVRTPEGGLEIRSPAGGLEIAATGRAEATVSVFGHGAWTRTEVP